MSEKEIVKHYKKGDFTIVWKPKRCIHSGVCVQKLPEVYHPNARPWITPENTTIAALKEQIKACPSGALSFDSQEEAEKTVESTKITVRPNGPVVINGTCEITHSDGSVEIKERVSVLCRCGGSENKPFCDGSHKTIGFQG